MYVLHVCVCPVCVCVCVSCVWVCVCRGVGGVVVCIVLCVSIVKYFVLYFWILLICGLFGLDIKCLQSNLPVP